METPNLLIAWSTAHRMCLLWITTKRAIRRIRFTAKQKNTSRIRMMVRSNKGGLPEPRYQYDRSGFEVKMKGKSSPKRSAKDSPKSSLKTEGRVLALMCANALTTAEQLDEKLGISKRALLKQISTLKEQQCLERVGPVRGGSWKVLEEKK